ncbi:MAG: sodium ion-translocating decarboxylase subunit beta, partial [Saprospiraceae bacterium]|nr:sodium ion-translocating decarboxylase subunit beta [Saprospiraceae bacterium]
DGPTAIYTSIILAPHLLGPIAIAAYSYMALVPVIIPFVVRFTVSKEELQINMKKQDQLFPDKQKIRQLQVVKILFPIVLGIIVSILVPSSVPLVGMLLFGNLIKEIGSDTRRLLSAASDTIMNTATIFLGLTIGATMSAATFLRGETLLIILGGLFAFMLSILGGIMAVKIYNLFARKKINPLIGATGLSAVPMASRVANEIALKHDKQNHLLQYAMSSNIAGVIGSAVAAGVLISFLG